MRKKLKYYISCFQCFQNFIDLRNRSNMGNYFTKIPKIFNVDLKMQIYRKNFVKKHLSNRKSDVFSSST